MGRSSLASLLIKIAVKGTSKQIKRSVKNSEKTKNQRKTIQRNYNYNADNRRQKASFQSSEGIKTIQLEAIDGFEFELQAMINDNYSFYLGHTNTEGEQNNEELISIDPDQTILGLSWVSDNGGFNIKGIANISEKSNVDRARVYDSLKRLVKRGIVEEEPVPRAPRYRANPPETVFGYIKEKLRNQIMTMVLFQILY